MYVSQYQVEHPNVNFEAQRSVSVGCSAANLYTGNWLRDLRVAICGLRHQQSQPPFSHAKLKIEVGAGS